MKWKFWSAWTKDKNIVTITILSESTYQILLTSFLIHQIPSPCLPQLSRTLTFSSLAPDYREFTVSTICAKSFHHGESSVWKLEAKLAVLGPGTSIPVSKCYRFYCNGFNGLTEIAQVADSTLNLSRTASPSIRNCSMSGIGKKPFRRSQRR